MSQTFTLGLTEGSNNVAQMIESVERALDVLELLEQRSSAKLAELAKELETSRATVFRVLTTLEARGYVEHVRAEKAYRLGPASLALAARSHASAVIRLAGPALADLASVTGETVNLALLRRGRLVYAAIFDGSYALRMSGTVGRVVPLHCTALGKAVLAATPADHRRSLVGPEPYEKLTQRTIRRWPPLKRELVATLERGWAVDDEESEVGAVCVAAPILGEDGYPLGAISVSGSASRLPAEARNAVGRAAQTWTEQISAQVGYEPASNPNQPRKGASS